MSLDDAEAVLRRFSGAMRMAVAQTLRDFGIEDDTHARGELEQDARILVITYAGIMPGWHSGIIPRMAGITGGDERQINLLVTHELKLALAQNLNRARSGRTVSLDAMLENGYGPADTDYEERMIDRIDNRAETARYRQTYPVLARNVLDGMSQPEIAAETGVPLRTVERRISQEKRAFLTEFLHRNGLRVTGNETTGELTEAYGYLTAGHPAAPLDAAA